MVITIDGPAGSGKSTAARGLAQRLGIAYLDTGATYRAVTLQALRRGTDLDSASALAELAARTDIRLEPGRDGVRVLLDGEDVSREIRSARVTRKSHYIARAAPVRGILVDLQRRIGAELGSFVAEGRDQGSVVFPQANVKFYLDATAEVRARRRRAELAAGGEDVPYEQVLQQIRRRDRRDSTRAADPLIRPADAIVVDTSGRNAEQVIDVLLDEVRKRT